VKALREHRVNFRDACSSTSRAVRAEVEIALAKGELAYDKCEAFLRKTTRREIERALKGRNR
jgi:tmRNA-binding protein